MKGHTSRGMVTQLRGEHLGQQNQVVNIFYKIKLIYLPERCSKSDLIIFDLIKIFIIADSLIFWLLRTNLSSIQVRK